jgi:hypothetical protein
MLLLLWVDEDVREWFGRYYRIIFSQFIENCLLVLVVLKIEGILFTFNDL